MNPKIKELMISRGLHKYISEDCQHRMEMLAEMIIQECIQVVHKQERIPEGFFMPNLHTYMSWQSNNILE